MRRCIILVLVRYVGYLKVTKSLKLRCTFVYIIMNVCAQFATAIPFNVRAAVNHRIMEKVLVKIGFDS